MTQDKSAMQAEALERAEQGQSMMNYPAIFAGFVAKGIPESDIKPRENVFTFNAWKAKGRSVKRGEHGVKVVTFIECGGSERDPSTGEVAEITYRRPHTSTVFHVSQTEETAEREARLAANGSSGRGRRYGRRARRGYDRPRDFVPDPGELAADRWIETHGDRF